MSTTKFTTKPGYILKLYFYQQHEILSRTIRAQIRFPMRWNKIGLSVLRIFPEQEKKEFDDIWMLDKRFILSGFDQEKT